MIYLPFSLPPRANIRLDVEIETTLHASLLMQSQHMSSLQTVCQKSNFNEMN